MRWAPEHRSFGEPSNEGWPANVHCVPTFHDEALSLGNQSMTRPSRTPQHERRARTRAAVLDAAARIFVERGFHDTKLDDVAEAAGVSKGAVYYYFSSK